VKGEIIFNSTAPFIYVSGIVAYEYNGSIMNIEAIVNITLNAVNAYVYGLGSSNVSYGLYYGDITVTVTGLAYVYGVTMNVYYGNMFYGNINVVSSSPSATSAYAYALGYQMYNNSPGCFCLGTINAYYNGNIPSTYCGAYNINSSVYTQYSLNVNGSNLVSSGFTDLNVLKNKDTFKSLFNISSYCYAYYALLSDGWYCNYLPEGFDYPMLSFCCERVEYTITVINNYTLEDTVTGDENTYQMGDVCTLTALSSIDRRFTFSKWMVNGEIVSTNTTYNFIVTGNTIVTVVYEYYMNAMTINHISTLFWISEQVNFGYDFDGIQIMLSKDLDFSYVTDQVWQTIGNSSHDFKGIFDCNGYSIKYDSSINDIQSGGIAIQGNNITLFYSGISGKVCDFVLIGDIDLGTTNSGDLYDELSNLESGEPTIWNKDRNISKPR